MHCAICKKEPKDIHEYAYESEYYGCTPDEFVKSQEGIYNPKEDVFYCTECYINIGMPPGKAHK